MKFAFTFVIIAFAFLTEELWAQKVPSKAKSPIHYSKSVKSNKKPSHRNHRKHKKQITQRLKKTKPISVFVFTNEKGSVVIRLPKAKLKAYKLIIYDTDLSHLFTIQKIPETELILEKGNFLHEGWFGYELFEEGKLLEKKQFYIPKN